MNVRALALSLSLLVAGCASGPSKSEEQPAAAHACPDCKADLGGVVHERCARCKADRPWWTHATKPADAPATRPMRVRCPTCGHDVPVEVEGACPTCGAKD